MPGVFPPWRSGGIHVLHMPALVANFSARSVLQFRWKVPHGTPGVPPLAPPPTGVALECCVKAAQTRPRRSEDRKPRHPDGSPPSTAAELAIALETWKEIKFEFDTVRQLDVKLNVFPFALPLTRIPCPS